MSAKNLVDGIKNYKFSCREVMRAYLKKIDKVNPTLNALVQRLDQAEALALANKADEDLAQGKIGKLHDVPITVKDIHVKGFKVSVGCRGLKNFHVEQPSHLLQKFLDIASQSEIFDAYEIRRRFFEADQLRGT